MTSYLIQILSHIRNLTILGVIMCSLTITACNNSQDQENSGSNVGTEQEALEIDTTANVSRGGTQESTGRADADTSGAGKASMPDSVR